MPDAIPSSLHPIVICEDRYQGGYSRGARWAIAVADAPFEGKNRLTWLWEHGPGSGDVDAGIFWRSPPPWIAAGSSPEAALAKLLSNARNDSDDWMPPPIEDDPRYRPSLLR